MFPYHHIVLLCSSSFLKLSCDLQESVTLLAVFEKKFLNLVHSDVQKFPVWGSKVTLKFMGMLFLFSSWEITQKFQEAVTSLPLHKEFSLTTCHLKKAYASSHGSVLIPTINVPKHVALP